LGVQSHASCATAEVLPTFERVFAAYCRFRKQTLRGVGSYKGKFQNGVSTNAKNIIRYNLKYAVVSYA